MSRILSVHFLESVHFDVCIGKSCIGKSCSSLVYQTACALEGSIKV